MDKIIAEDNIHCLVSDYFGLFTPSIELLYSGHRFFKKHFKLKDVPFLQAYSVDITGGSLGIS